MENLHKRITQGDWKSKGVDADGSLLIRVKGRAIPVARILTESKISYKCALEQHENTKAICKAVNNTYGKGIDPEKIETVIKRLSEIVRYHNDPKYADMCDQATEDTTSTAMDALIISAETALESIKLTDHSGAEQSV